MSRVRVPPSHHPSLTRSAVPCRCTTTPPSSTRAVKSTRSSGSTDRRFRMSCPSAARSTPPYRGCSQDKSTTSPGTPPCSRTILNRCRTSDGYCLSIAWTHGYAIYSVYGRLGSWSVAPLSAIEGSASKVRSGGFGEEEGYGVQGERGVGFEDNYLNGVKSAVSSFPFCAGLTSAVLERGQLGTVCPLSSTRTSEGQGSVLLLRASDGADRD